MKKPLTIVGLVALCFVVILGVFPALTQAQAGGSRNDAWSGEYFTNRYLSGAPALVRYDAAIDFDWGYGSPAVGFPGDNFSVRWNRDIHLTDGTYRVTARADDGVRVYVDGNLIIDQWHISSPSDHSAEIILGEGWHPFRVEYFEATQRAEVKVTWEQLEFPAPPPNAGWQGSYYANRNLTGSPVAVRQDPSIDFDWGTGAPAPGMPKDEFSVRWLGDWYFDGGTYEFTAETDDGVRLYVNRQLLLDRWRHQSATPRKTKVALPSGVHQLRMDYFEGGGEASAKLTWKKIGVGPTPPTPSVSWLGEYFANRNLQGPPVLTRIDPAIDFDWGTGSPAPEVPPDNFSVRWSGSVPLDTGKYRIRVNTDDGARVYIGNRLVIDRWQTGAAEVVVDLDVNRETYQVRVEYFEATGRALAKFSWEKIDEYVPVEPKGWLGEYFDNRDLEGLPVITRDDPEIDFDWGKGSPAPAIPTGFFSARWTQTIDLDGGTYEFRTETDDGVRLYIDNQLLIDRWKTQGLTPYAKEINITPGPHDIRMEYFEDGGDAVAKLTWRRIGSSGGSDGGSGGGSGGGGGGQDTVWLGEYFNNTGLSGKPTMNRRDYFVNFDWGSGSPAPTISDDKFSVRWTRRMFLPQGRYRFTTETDDGVRLWIDGQRLINQWHPMSRTRFVTDVSLLEGYHDIRMEYFEDTALASANLTWEKIKDEITPSAGNIVTCVAPPPASSWIKVYQLIGDNQWRDVKPSGWGAMDKAGNVRIDGLAVHLETFGNVGHPYRVEQWVAGTLINSVGNIYSGEPEFRVKGGVDNYPPWKCPY
ncbi:MAG: PA14 domain-containing protein [Chloroflexota bacterium]|nr:PA14 domain-containing protein [Chloroflexota bacterium]